jgi:hypothetical protein
MVFCLRGDSPNDEPARAALLSCLYSSAFAVTHHGHTRRDCDATAVALFLWPAAHCTPSVNNDGKCPLLRLILPFSSSLIILSCCTVRDSRWGDGPGRRARCP